MKQPLVSVIIPVYRVEPYLEKCVRSVKNCDAKPKISTLTLTVLMHRGIIQAERGNNTPAGMSRRSEIQPTV